MRGCDRRTMAEQQAKDYGTLSDREPAVSVVIPFYRGVEWLKEAVDSVCAQTRPVQEVIVVDDGSPEDVSSFLEEYGSRVTYRRTVNQGPAAARNVGIDLASGDFIAFLNSDDLWAPQKNEVRLSKMLELGAVWSHTSYELFDTDSVDRPVLRTVDVSGFTGTAFPRMLYSNPFATPSVMIQASVLKEDSALRFGRAMRYGQDQYLWMKMVLRYPVLAIGEPLVRVRMRGTNAALRARVQLRAKAVLRLRLESEEPGRFAELAGSARFAYRLCGIGEGALASLESRWPEQEARLEWASRALYAVPWVLFKANARRESRVR